MEQKGRTTSNAPRPFRFTRERAPDLAPELFLYVTFGQRSQRVFDKSIIQRNLIIEYGVRPREHENPGRVQKADDPLLGRADDGPISPTNGRAKAERTCRDEGAEAKPTPDIKKGSG